MIDYEYLEMMANYNQWQNENLYNAGDQLSDDARKQDRGAFFGSIHHTLCHLLWGDMIWTSRFAGLNRPTVNSIQQSSDPSPWTSSCNDYRGRGHPDDTELSVMSMR